jgi:DNA-binding NarL/FixJ family response regulator
MDAGEVVIVAPEGATLGAIFHALLSADGWSVTRYHRAEDVLPAPAGRPVVVLLEDDDGAVGVRLPDQLNLGGVVCIGSMNSIATLVRYAGRGATVLNHAVPILVLLAAVRTALRAARPVPGGSTAAAVDLTDQRRVGELLRRQQEAQYLAGLTGAESEVLRKIVAGWSAAEIAARDHLSIHTVRSHLKSILSKLEVSTQVAAVAMAHRSGQYDWLHAGQVRFTNFGEETVQSDGQP